MQSWQTCALSGQQIEIPVISRVSGNIFEKRLIEKHIESTGTCPITGRPLNYEDLIEVKVSTTQKPRPINATSIPNLLSLLQNEWDTMMLEQFQLKQHLEQVRSELTHSLYQHDAACRVIAKLIKERDQARIELAQLQQKIQGRQSMETEQIDRLPQHIVDDLTQISQKLNNQRKAQRKQASFFESFPTAQNISNYEIKLQDHIHQSIVQVDVNRDNNNLIALGGLNGEVILYDRVEKKSVYHSDRHQQKITFIKFYYIDETVRFVTGSEDGNIFFYQFEDNKGQLLNSQEGPIPVVGGDVHPIQYLLVIAYQNGVFGYIDLKNQQLITRVTDFEDSVHFTSVAIHPDGKIMVFGQKDSNIKVWSIIQHSLVLQLEGNNGPITGVKFSESGVIMATTTNTDVKIWNLRDGSISKRIELNKVGCVNFDPSGQFLAVGINKFINFYDTTNYEIFSRQESHRDLVTAIEFGDRGYVIVSGSLDKQFNIYGN
ncbi:hypothetical protein pb186bvf_011710 [Paramecium bursaria]